MCIFCHLIHPPPPVFAIDLALSGRRAVLALCGIDGHFNLLEDPADAPTLSAVPDLPAEPQGLAAVQTA